MNHIVGIKRGVLATHTQIINQSKLLIKHSGSISPL